MKTPFIRRDAPANVLRVVATLYPDPHTFEPIADVFDPKAVPLLMAAPQMADALRHALALLRNPDAEAQDATLAESVIVAALRQANEPETAPGAARETSPVPI